MLLFPGGIRTFLPSGDLGYLEGEEIEAAGLFIYDVCGSFSLTTWVGQQVIAARPLTRCGRNQFVSVVRRNVTCTAADAVSTIFGFLCCLTYSLNTHLHILIFVS